MEKNMSAIAVSTFRAHLLHYLKKVERGEKILITSHGEQMAMLVPPQDKAESAQQKLKNLRKTACLADVIMPVSNDWKVLP